MVGENFLCSYVTLCRKNFTISAYVKCVVVVNRLSQVNISMQSYLGKYQYVYTGLCTEMNYKIKFPFMWSMGFLLVKCSQEDFKCVSFFFFQMCL